MQNVSVAANESDGDVTFLRAVREGLSDHFYGVHITDLAGLPAPIVGRAQEVHQFLSNDKAINVLAFDPERIDDVYA